MLRISQNNSETPDHSLVSTAAANIYGSRGIRINLYCFGRRFNSLGSYRPGLLPTRRSEIALKTSHHCFSIRPARTRNVEANSSIACITPVKFRRVGDSRYPSIRIPASRHGLNYSRSDGTGSLCEPSMGFGIENVPLSSASSSLGYAIPPTSDDHRAMHDLLPCKPLHPRAWSPTLLDNFDSPSDVPCNGDGERESHPDTS